MTIKLKFDKKTKKWKEAGKHKKMTKRQLDALRKRQEQWKAAEAKCEDLRKLEDAAWKKYIPRLLERYKKAPKVDKGIWGDFFPEGIRDTEIQLMDSVGQKLDFRVGPVFGKKGIYKEPGIWIGFQRRYMNSSRQGDLLISPEMWRRLNREMELRFKEFRAREYGHGKVISVKKGK